MALRVTVLLIYAGLTGIQSLNTVKHVMVEAGRSVSIPCLYETHYKDHVKYLCRGEAWASCKSVIKTNQRNSSKYSIHDDKKQRIVTFTFNNVWMEDNDFYWCNVEKQLTDDGVLFQLSVTKKGESRLFVDSQWITGYFRDQITIFCNVSGYGDKKWSSFGGIINTDGKKVNINNSVGPGAYAVTMRDLGPKDIGWYWCDFRELQMPVFLQITEKPTTTTRATTTITTTLTTTATATTTQGLTPVISGTRSVPDYIKAAVIALALLIVIVAASLFIWFKLKRSIKTQVESSSPECGDDPVYSNVSNQRPVSHQNLCTDKETDVMYSSVSFIKTEQSNKVEVQEDVLYSTLAQQ